MQAKRRHLLYSALIALVVFALSGCTAAIPAAEAPATEAPAAEAPAAEVPAGMEELVAAAQAEGELTVIALPRDWCNYGEVIDSFAAKYGIKVNELDPNAGSGDELEAIKANKDNKGPQAPDVIDVGFAFGPQAVAEGLLQPYKVSTWETIPESAKDPEGYWYGDYYGVMAFLVNKDVVANTPQSWLDLAKPEYKGQFALSGDPRTSNQAILSIQAASLANGGTLADPTAGLELMAQVNQAGNLVPVIALPGTVALGETPITAVWDYNALSWADGFEGNPATEVVIPSDGRIAGVYLQGISAYAPHPNAAKLWMEHLYSDEGQLMWMKGYCRPIREADLRERGAIPDEIAAKIPDASGVVFPTLDELVTGKQVIVENWDSVVGADVKAAQ
ncbi:MAG TPA: iron ABC transporter substrate-binding protein [Chloroflexi bacterium]|nr:iron ABC transporter substrate-binding protein [Chloroflexota bacterium]HHW86570.1 ABC transporter substrate-binding protein [Chloroflexota bacterium]